jgi:hypothetical protein
MVLVELVEVLSRGPASFLVILGQHNQLGAGHRTLECEDFDAMAISRRRCRCRWCVWGGEPEPKPEPGNWDG